MKSEWVTKKTIIKKHGTQHVAATSHLAMYDYTQKSLDDVDVIPLSEYEDIFELDNEQGDLCLDPSIHSFEDAEDVITWCATLIVQSQTLNSLWTSAMNTGWVVGLTTLENQGFYLDIPAKKILLDDYAMSPETLGYSAFFRNDILLNFMRALRDISHHSREDGFEKQYGPENILILERVRAADCDTIGILGAWELRSAGHPDIWRHLIGSPEGDMALAFTQYLERDPTALFDGSALAYAFRQWFTDDERVDACDHETLEYLDDILFEVGDSNPFGQKRLDGKIIESLAKLPNETCYLKRLGDMILEDPYYAGMNDPINQAHLFQMVYDLKVIMVNNVPFSDQKLARKIFPDGDHKEQWK